MLVFDTDQPEHARTKVLDFGIAKLLEGNQVSNLKTRTDVVMGTPSYMSPEQCMGAGQVDDRSDVYSLGVILYEMLAGQRPFNSEGSGALIGMHLYKEPPPLRQIAKHVPEDVAGFVHALLVKAKEKRPRMREVADQLEQMIEHSGKLHTARPSSSWVFSLFKTIRPTFRTDLTLGQSTGQTEVSARARRRVLRWALFNTVAALSIGGLITGYWLRHPHSSAPPPVSAPLSAEFEYATTAPDMIPSALPSPVTIEWNITTVPPGARVILKQTGAELGNTPLTLPRTAVPGRLPVLLMLDGYTPLEFLLPTDRDVNVDKQLVPLRRSIPVSPVRSASPAPRRLPQGNASISPAPVKPAVPAKMPPIPPRPTTNDILEK